MKYIDPNQKILQHLEELALIKAGFHPAPVNVEIDLTNRCNLGCDECHFAYTHTRGPLASRPKPEGLNSVGDQFDFPILVHVLSELARCSVQSVTWTGGGEPTLYGGFEDAVLTADSLNLRQGIYTNGTLISAERAQLMKSKMEWVYVSLDRHTPETYKSYKKVDVFHKAIEGIKHLVEANGEATIGVGFLLDEHSWGHGPQMIELASDLGADYVQFRPLIEFDMVKPNKKSGDTSWVKPAVQWLNGVSGVRQGKTLVIADTQRFMQYRNWIKHPYPTCYWTQMQTVITPNAKVWTCVNRRGFAGDCLGDLTQESFEEIWKKSGAFKVNDHCRLMCRGHIPNQTLNQLMTEVPHKEFI